MERCVLRALVVGALCLLPLPSEANAGVPLFSHYVAYSWLLLIPIIGVEAYVFRKRLPVSVARSAGVSILANAASTLLGTVVVGGGGLLFALVLGVVELPGTMADLVVLIALYPAFRLSVWIEAGVSRRLLRPVLEEEVRTVVRLANRFSYVMLAILAVGRIIKSAIVNGSIVF